MTAREHYREAERLMGEARSLGSGHPHYGDESTALIAAAQVHATLALAAATAPELASNGGKVGG